MHNYDVERHRDDASVRSLPWFDEGMKAARNRREKRWAKSSQIHEDDNSQSPSEEDLAAVAAAAVAQAAAAQRNLSNRPRE